MINWFDYLHSIFNVPINMPGIDEKDFKDLGDSSYFSVSTDYSDDEMNNILNSMQFYRDHIQNSEFNDLELHEENEEEIGLESSAFEVEINNENKNENENIQYRKRNGPTYKFPSHYLRSHFMRLYRRKKLYIVNQNANNKSRQIQMTIKFNNTEI